MFGWLTTESPNFMTKIRNAAKGQKESPAFRSLRGPIHHQAEPDAWKSSSRPT